MVGASRGDTVDIEYILNYKAVTGEMQGVSQRDSRASCLATDRLNQSYFQLEDPGNVSVCREGRRVSRPRPRNIGDYKSIFASHN